MERSFGNDRCWLSVISTGRPENVIKMQDQVGDATWYIKREDVSAYENAPSVQVCRPGVSVARNTALEDAFARDLTCVQFSDDLHGFRFVSEDKQVTPLDTDDALGVLLQYLHMMQYFLAGLPPTDNIFFSSTKVTYDTFIVGDCIAVKPNPLRFDEELKLKEDYGYTAAHIQKYGGTLRLNWILANFSHRKNPGGAVDLRTRTVEREAMTRLMQVYPGWFKLNKKREGTEILMRVPHSHEVME